MQSYLIRKISNYNKKENKYKYKYYDNGLLISNKTIKPYIYNLYIPPAYDNVKINKDKSSNILAIGYDTKNRAQYIYNTKFSIQSKNKKFNQLINFGNDYSKIISKINLDLNAKNESKEKQIAIILKIIIECNFRIGNEKYTKQNNSYGVSTLKKKHIQIKKNKIMIDFIGKKGVRNQCSLKNKNIISNVKKKRKTINKNDTLFSYKSSGKYKKITSNDVNNYLKQFGDYTTKNFRTWGANIKLIKLLLKNINIIESIKLVSEELHHTPSVCKKNYLDDNLIDFYKKDPNKFKSYFKGRNIDKNLTKFLMKYY